MKRSRKLIPKDSRTLWNASESYLSKSVAWSPVWCI